ncbi:hypothetical protein ACFC09_27780 [Streptomyces sp. NPDC056161]|uniref:hypothetical protein n=1 Tax=Streptomyces sp. NPDC056161 TaxID=3345732 RepID=UPI0035D7FE54
MGARRGRDESKANGVDGDASNARQRHVIDWLEQAPDLPHLIARVSELVLRLGYEPDDLVIMPRGELDRREMAAYSAGWADVVDEQLPAVRRAYEQRITAAYAQGQEDGRTGRRPRASSRSEGERRSDGGGEVIPLHFVQLLRPPSELTRVERRGERERSVADGTPLPTPVFGQADRGGPQGQQQGQHRQQGQQGQQGRQGHRGHEGEGSGQGGAGAGVVHAASEEVEGDWQGRAADEGPHDADAGPGPGSDTLLSAREVRERRAVPGAERRSVVRRNGRPSVPPLTRPQEAGANGRDRGRRTEPPDRPPQEQTGPAGHRNEERTRLSDKARALADELEGRAPDRHRDE